MQTKHRQLLIVIHMRAHTYTRANLRRGIYCVKYGICLLLLCTFVCCALFELGGLFCVFSLIELPLPPGKNPFAVK
jgi:hypothetical protein